MTPDNAAHARSTRRRTRGVVLVAMALVFVGPAAAAFVNKFLEFWHAMRSDAVGNAALIPMLNYLAVALGFLCLLTWAIAGGMFRDVEAPKYALLENEERLDQLEGHKEIS